MAIPDGISPSRRVTPREASEASLDQEVLENGMCPLPRPAAPSSRPHDACALLSRLP